MLTLTETATTVIKSLVSRGTDATDGGLRINTTEANPREFLVDVVESPMAGDSVVDTDGARIFVGETAAVLLDNKVLDAQVTGEGAVSFALLPQP
jgi:iron-sulfur cluster assembly protein